MTCDSDDYYNSEQNMNAIYLPNITKKTIVYRVFNTGAYQETMVDMVVTPLFNSTTQTHINREMKTESWQLKFFRTTNFPRCP
jgi:arginine decarboxylase-like protein